MRLPKPENMKAGRWWDDGVMLIDGCMPAGQGCKNCWSAGMTHRFHAKKGLTDSEGNWNHKVVFNERFLKRFNKKDPTFFAIWNDLFQKDISDEQIRESLIAMSLTRGKGHIMQILTKRIKRAERLLNQWRQAGLTYCEGSTGILPSFIWLGTSASTQKELDKGVSYLLKTPAAVRFLSLEPLIEDLDFIEIQPFRSVRFRSGHYQGVRGILSGHIDFVIVGCESGAKRRPCKLEWIAKIVEQCKAAGVACWVKQMEIDGKVCHDIDKFPKELRVREMPEAAC